MISQLLRWGSKLVTLKAILIISLVFNLSILTWIMHGSTSEFKVLSYVSIDSIKRQLSLESTLPPGFCIATPPIQSDHQGDSDYSNSDKSAQTVKWGVYQSINSFTLRKVNKFLLIFGYSQSRDGLIGTLLNAHSHVVVVPEPDMLFSLQDGNFNENERNKFLNGIARRALARAYSVMKGIAHPPSWRYGIIPGLYSGVYQDFISIFGLDTADVLTEKNWNNSDFIFQNTKYLHIFTGLPLVAIHEVQHPLESIATIYCENIPHLTLQQAATRYFKLVELNVHYFQNVPKLKYVHIHTEDALQQPKATLTAVCNMLGVFCDKNYLEMTSAVFKQKERTMREGIEWDESVMQMIVRNSERYSFLKGYFHGNITSNTITLQKNK